MIRKLARYYRPHFRLFLADMACALLVAGINIFYPIITRTIINDYVPNGNARLLIIWSAALLGMYIIKAGLNYFIQFYGHVMGVRIQVDIRRDAFDHLQRLPFAFFDKTKTGTIMSRIINDTFEISEFCHHGPEDLFISITTMLGAFIYLGFWINLPLTLIIFACVPLLVVFAAKKRIKLARTSMKTRVEIGEVNADLENSIAGVRVSRAFETSHHESEKFDAGNQAYAKARGQQYSAMAEFFSGTGLIMDILVLVTMLSGGLFCLRGIIRPGDYAAYLLFVGLFTDPVKKLINFVEQLQSGITGFQRVQELLVVPTEEDAENAVELCDVRGDINFEHIAFHYDEGQNVLTDLSLAIAPGETVALVGPSGGGKSTLCHLIPRFYELDSGRILLDGKDIREYTRLSLRRQIGIVQQDTFLFTGTIRDNIAYGDFAATEEQIAAAAKAADIHDFIDSLPHGYDTFVGERGVMLSGGQKQRISIARVFLKNPPILILDEATSALDNTTERNIQAALESLSAGRTTLVVAHRLTTVRHADKIVVLTGEGIAEVGSHEQLLAKGGLYAKLWQMQEMTAGTDL